MFTGARVAAVCSFAFSDFRSEVGLLRPHSSSDLRLRLALDDALIFLAFLVSERRVQPCAGVAPSSSGRSDGVRDDGSWPAPLLPEVVSRAAGAASLHKQNRRARRRGLGVGAGGHATAQSSRVSWRISPECGRWRSWRRVGADFSSVPWRYGSVDCCIIIAIVSSGRRRVASQCC